MQPSLKGLRLATQYHSKRHVARLEGMYHRLSVTPLGQEKQLKEIKDALREIQHKQMNW